MVKRFPPSICRTAPSRGRRASIPGKRGKFTTGPEGLTAQLVYVGDGSEEDFDEVDVRGKIAVGDVRFKQIDYRDWAQGLASFYHDPAGSFVQGAGHPDPFTPNTYPFNYFRAMERGAAGFVGVLVDYIDSNAFYAEDFSYAADSVMSIPGLWVTRSVGEEIKAKLKRGAVDGRLHLTGAVKKTTGHFVVGHLPGKSRETIMVQSHHDSAFGGAVQDASGCASVLALARYFAAQPLAKRERSMMFVTMDTHYANYEAHDAFIDRYLKGQHPIVVDVAVEHIAREMVVRDGRGVMTGDIEPRLFVVSNSGPLQALTRRAIVRHDYRRSLLIPTIRFTETGGDVPTDAGAFYLDAKLPIISMISGPIYLYDIADTVDKVAVEELQPTAALFADIIEQLDVMPSESFKEEAK